MISVFGLKNSLLQVALLLVASTSLFCGGPIGSTETVEATQSAVLSVPPTPAPAQPTPPAAQKAVSEGRVRRVPRQRHQPAASLRFDARNSVSGFTPALMSMKARAELDTAIEMYRAMEMPYWLEKAEAEMRELG